MGEHVRALGIIGILRAVIAVAIGSWLLVKAGGLSLEAYGATRPSLETMLQDQLTFRIVGWALLVLAPVWAAQATLALARKPAARPFGLGIAILDLLSLFFFPLSTALGFYGTVVYHNPETELFLRDGRAREGGPGSRLPK